MTEYMSFQEIMKIVKNGDKLATSTEGSCHYSNNILRWNNFDNEPITYPWDLKLKIIKPEPEMVTLVRPKFYQDPGAPRPYSNCGWYESKEEWIEKHSGWLTFGEWETLTVPKNAEDWIDGDS